MKASPVSSAYCAKLGVRESGAKSSLLSCSDSSATAPSGAAKAASSQTP
jgi:hypothetical protein